VFKKLSDIIKVIIGWYSILAELGVSIEKHCDNCDRVIYAPEFESTHCKVCRKYMLDWYGEDDIDLKEYPKLYR